MYTYIHIKQSVPFHQKLNASFWGPYTGNNYIHNIRLGTDSNTPIVLNSPVVRGLAKNVKDPCLIFSFA